MTFMLLNDRSVMDDETICALFLKALNLYYDYSANGYEFYKMSFCIVESKKNGKITCRFLLKVWIRSYIPYLSQ